MREKTRSRLILFFSVILASLGAFVWASRGVTSKVVTIPNGGDRARVTVESPRSFSGKIPLVVVLHGFRSGPIPQSFYFRFGKFVARKKFHLAFLEGTKNRAGDRFWDASNACCDLDHSGTDDVAYVAATIRALREQLPVSKVFVVGHSNGGFMAYRLACDSPGIDGVFSLAGMDEERPCRAGPFHGFRVLHAHGTADRVISPAGGSFRGLPRYASLETTLQVWERRLGCVRGEWKKRDGLFFGGDGRMEVANCGDGNRMASIRFEGGGHIPWIRDSFREEILDFLFQ